MVGVLRPSFSSDRVLIFELDCCVVVVVVVVVAK